MVYRDVSIHAERAADASRPDPIYTVSVDEKPGVQALGLTAPDLPPVLGMARAIGRDYEYVRHGTVSILAGIDLHSGHSFANVEDRHRSVEFIGLLKRLDAYYPPEATNPRGAGQSLGPHLEGDHRLSRHSGRGASSTSIRPSTVPGST
jgi:hypothetical protein